MTEQEIRTIMEHRIEQWLLKTRVRAEARRAYQRQQQQVKASPPVPWVQPPLLRKSLGKRRDGQPDRRFSPEARARQSELKRQYWADQRARKELECSRWRAV